MTRFAGLCAAVSSPRPWRPKLPVSGSASVGGEDVKPDIKPVIQRGPPAYGYYYPVAAAAPAAAAQAAIPALVKPEPMGLNIPIQIRVRDQQGGEVQFKVKSHTRFSKIFDAYCSKRSVEPGSFRFVFDGTRLNPESWPRAHDMEHDDAIDAFAEQRGGRPQQC